MLRSLGLVSQLVGCSMLAGCVGGGSDAPCVPPNTSIAVSRAGPAGACSAAVVAGVTSLNGSETFTPMKGIACGMVHFTLTVNFFAQDNNHASCMGSDAIAFQDYGANGSTSDTGTDTMSITCSDGTACSETFNVTFTHP